MNRLTNSGRRPRRHRAAGVTALLGLTLAAACSSAETDAAAYAAEPGAAQGADAGAALRTLPSDTAVQRALRASLASDTPPAGLEATWWSRTRALYDSTRRPLWMTGEGTLDEGRARALVEAVGRAPQQGLDLGAYPLAAAREAVTRARGARDARARAEADLMLSALFAAYGDDLLTGRVDPREASGGAWHIDVNADVDSALWRAVRAPDLSNTLDRLVPREEEYRALMVGLERYRKLADAGGWSAVPGSGVVRPGDDDPAVPALRERLAREGYLDAAAGGTQYDAALAGAVARFQEAHGLEVDSALGPNTRAALNVPAAHRAAQIAASLERMRWLPPHLGDRYVVVNVPAYRLAAYEDGRQALTMRVVVGAEYNDRETPIFSDSMAYVQFGPYWNVPASITNEEILPKVRADRGYLAANEFEIVEGWSDHPPVIDVWSLSAAQLQPGSFPYRIRQRPGPGNALGRVKFIFPNDFAVYLHDTPAQHLFSQAERAASHGCVRVADPADLATWVLQDNATWDASRIRRALATGERERVYLDDKLPVYMLYLTAFPQDSSVAFRDDVYGQDGRLIRALGGEGALADRSRASAPAIGALRDAVEE